jgi:hypothetical protein
LNDDQLGRALETLEALGDHELALAELYGTFARVWTDDGAMWKNLASSERSHAGALRRLARIVAARPGAFRPARALTAAATKLQADYVMSRAAEVASGVVARRTAMLMARDIESSILETRFDELFDTDDGDYLTIAAGVVAETGAHYRLLEQRLRADQ